MGVGEGGRHHRSHHASLSALLLATVPGSKVTIVGKTQDVTLGLAPRQMRLEIETDQLVCQDEGGTETLIPV